jgi:hypothetical protein
VPFSLRRRAQVHSGGRARGVFSRTPELLHSYRRRFPIEAVDSFTSTPSSAGMSKKRPLPDDSLSVVASHEVRGNLCPHRTSPRYAEEMLMAHDIFTDGDKPGVRLKRPARSGGTPCTTTLILGQSSATYA